MSESLKNKNSNTSNVKQPLLLDCKLRYPWKTGPSLPGTLPHMDPQEGNTKKKYINFRTWAPSPPRKCPHLPYLVFPPLSSTVSPAALQPTTLTHPFQVNHLEPPNLPTPHQPSQPTTFPPPGGQPTHPPFTGPSSTRPCHLPDQIVPSETPAARSLRTLGRYVTSHRPRPPDLVPTGRSTKAPGLSSGDREKHEKKVYSESKTHHFWGWKTLQNSALSNKNKGHLGYR